MNNDSAPLIIHYQLLQLLYNAFPVPYFVYSLTAWYMYVMSCVKDYGRDI